MDESILNGIKKILGIDASYTAFDFDIIVFINGALATAEQAGAGNVVTTIQDAGATWDTLGLTEKNLAIMKNYIFLKAKLLFDPPATSFTQEAYRAQIEEMETRMQINTQLEVTTP